MEKITQNRSSWNEDLEIFDKSKNAEEHKMDLKKKPKNPIDEVLGFVSTVKKVHRNFKFLAKLFK